MPINPFITSFELSFRNMSTRWVEVEAPLLIASPLKILPSYHQKIVRAFGHSWEATGVMYASKQYPKDEALIRIIAHRNCRYAYNPPPNDLARAWDTPPYQHWGKGGLWIDPSDTESYEILGPVRVGLP